jgi:hypothetical protein
MISKTNSCRYFNQTRLIINLHHLTTGDADLASIDICPHCLTHRTLLKHLHIYLLAPTPSSDVEYTLRDSLWESSTPVVAPSRNAA